MSDVTPKFSVPQFSDWSVFILIAVGPSEAYNLPDPLSETQAESVLAGNPVT